MVSRPDCCGEKNAADLFRGRRKIKAAIPPERREGEAEGGMGTLFGPGGELPVRLPSLHEFLGVPSHNAPVLRVELRAAFQPTLAPELRLGPPPRPFHRSTTQRRTRHRRHSQKSERTGYGKVILERVRHFFYPDSKGGGGDSGRLAQRRSGMFYVRGRVDERVDERAVLCAILRAA